MLPFLKWGSQKHLRCMKVEDASTTASTATAANHRNLNQHRRSPPLKFKTLISVRINRQETDSLNHNYKLRERRLRTTKPRNDGEAEGIEAVREKIMKDLKTAADKIKDANFQERVSDGEDEKLGRPVQKVAEKAREESPISEVESRP